MTLLRWGETGKRKRREPASARAMRGELRVSIPFNPMSATPITILSRAHMDIIDSRLLYFQHYLEGILQKKMLSLISAAD